LTSLEKLEVAPPSPGQLKHGKRRMFGCGSVFVQSVFELLHLSPMSAGLSSSLSYEITENESKHRRSPCRLYFITPHLENAHRSVKVGQKAPTSACCSKPAANTFF